MEYYVVNDLKKEAKKFIIKVAELTEYESNNKK